MPDSTFSARRIGYFIAAAAVVVLAIAIFSVDRHPRTDDATVRANSIAFAPEVEGRLVALNVQDNQRVHKGDLLFQIDPRPFEYALQQADSEQSTLENQIEDWRRHIATEKSAVGTAHAGVLGSQSNISAAESAVLAAKASVERAHAAQISTDAQLKYAQNDLDRIAPLMAKHYVTTQQLDQAQTAVRVAQEASHQAASQLLQAQAQEKMAVASQQAASASLEASQSKLGEAEHTVDNLDTLTSQRQARVAKVEQAKLNLAWTSVRAPFDGYVTNMNTSQGAYAHVGTPIFTLIDTSTWWVLANYRESKLKHIRPGQHVAVYLMDQPSKRYDGVVDSIGRGVFPEDGGTADGLPNVDRTLNWVHLSARFPVRIRVLNPDPETFRIGATAITVAR